jgi:hypothetical protein
MINKKSPFTPNIDIFVAKAGDAYGTHFALNS